MLRRGLVGLVALGLFAARVYSDSGTNSVLEPTAKMPPVFAASTRDLTMKTSTFINSQIVTLSAAHIARGASARVDQSRFVRVKYSVNARFPGHPSGKDPEFPTITFMPRRMAHRAGRAVTALRQQPTPRWRIQAINTVDENTVADMLDSSRIFLSFSEFEGLTLPPLEAAMAGNVQDIINTSIRNDSPNFVTGASLSDGANVIQVPEGEEDQVRATFRRIGLDSRLAGFTFIDMDVIAQRDFGSRWMRRAYRNDRAAPIFARFTRGETFNPRRLAMSEVLALLDELGSRDTAGEAGYADDLCAPLVRALMAGLAGAS